VRLYTSLVAAATAGARLVITDSAASRADILGHLNVPPERSVAIPLAVDASLNPNALAQDDVWRSRHNLPRDYVLYLGGFDVRKNVATLLRAFAIVRRACPDATLVIAGRTPRRDSRFTPDPRRIAVEVGLSPDSIRFLGFVAEEEKPALIRNSRVLVYPSTYEGFGYPLLEALACGVPVVGSETTSLPEVIGDAGVLVDPYDVEGMAGAVIQLVTDNAFHRDLSERAVRRSRAFSWRQTASQTAAAYAAALGA
jgi:glycosyltransferase involved in cell wall biosynthesis